jgi:hypothetical protein
MLACLHHSLNMREIIKITLFSGLLATCNAASSERFERMRYWRETDLRLVVLEKNELRTLRDSGQILINLATFAPPEATRDVLDKKYIVKQPAGATLDDHLKALEVERGRFLQKQLRILFYSISQARLIEIRDIPKELGGLLTKPGDIVFILPGVW